MNRGPRVLVRLKGRLGAYAPAMERAACRTLRRIARAAGLTARHELSLVLCDNAAIRAVNRRWRALDHPTDVLSFPLHQLRPRQLPPVGPLGDILISLPAARSIARREGSPPKLIVQWLVVHGFLHLLGYDHHTPQAARAMRRQERRLLGQPLPP